MNRSTPIPVGSGKSPNGSEIWNGTERRMQRRLLKACRLFDPFYSEPTELQEIRAWSKKESLRKPRPQ